MTPTNTESEATVAKTKFTAWPYYKTAFAVLVKNPRLVVWKIGSGFFARVAALIALVSIAALFAAHLDAFAHTGRSSSWLFELNAILRSPAFLLGSCGILFVVWLSALLVDALVMGGVFSTLASGLKDGDDEPIPFFERASRRLDGVIGLSLVSLGARAGLVLCAASVIVASALALGPGGGLAELPLLGRAALWALGLSIYAVLAVLVRLSVEVVAAPMFLEDESLTESVLKAAAFVTDHVFELYRIFVTMLAVLLIPMAIYWVVLMVQNALMLAPALDLLGLAIRLAGELFLFASLAGVGVLFYGAIFAFYSERRAPGAPEPK
ncbi:MAG: hypothetical protein H0U74_23625 [Bradymonadaceae bacterium]|nr:hypothetical protein [Lujinxingiaceae bacterium]